MGERYVCTKDAPWSRDKGEFSQHPDAIDEGECSDSCCDLYHCQNCGLHFRVEVGQ